MSEFFKNLQKNLKNVQKIQFYSNFLSEMLVFCERKSQWAKETSDSLICPFIMRDLSEWLTSLLFCHERPERFAHLSWAIWANAQMSDERMSDERFEWMSEFPTLKKIVSLSYRVFCYQIYSLNQFVKQTPYIVVLKGYVRVQNVSAF